MRTLKEGIKEGEAWAGLADAARRRSQPAGQCAALLLRPPAAAAALAEGEVTLRQPVSAWVLVVGDESRA